MENNTMNHMNKNFIWTIVVIIVAIVSYTLGAKTTVAPTVSSTDSEAPIATPVTSPVASVQVTAPAVTVTKPVVTTTVPKSTGTAATVRVYTPNGGEIWVIGANTEIDTVVKLGTNGMLNLSLIDETGKSYALGTFKVDPKVEVQRSNVYVSTRQTLGKYKIYASLTSNGVTVGDTSDDYFTISK